MKEREALFRIAEKIAEICPEVDVGKLPPEDLANATIGLLGIVLRARESLARACELEGRVIELEIRLGLRSAAPN